VVFALLVHVKAVAIPALLAFALAYALNPLVASMCKVGFSRLFSVIIVFAGLLGLLLGFIFYLIPVLRAQFLRIPDSFSRAKDLIVPWMGTLEDSIPEALHGAIVSLREGVDSFLNELGPALAQLVGSIASSTPGIINVLIGIGLVPVLSITFLLSWNVLVRKSMQCIPPWARTQVKQRSRELDEVLSGFVRGQLWVGCILTVCYATGFRLAGIDMAILIALVAGFGNILPYVGTAAGIALAGIALLLSPETGWGQVLGVTVTFVITQALEGFLITPKIVGDRVGLPAIVVIVAVFTFGELFGFMGILLSVPVTAVLKVVLKVLLFRYREISWYAKG
jgi:predicted PurR-regulated permease PerM